MANTFQTICFFSALIVLGSFSGSASAQNTSESDAHTPVIRDIQPQLIWHGQSEQRAYELTKEQNILSFLKEVDGFVIDGFAPTKTKPEEVVRSLRNLLKYNPRSSPNAFAFTATLPAGKFLIIGIDVRRGSRAISEDLMSFRAYKAGEDKYALVAETELSSSDEKNHILSNLYAASVMRQPSAEQFLFFASADTSIASPPKVVLQLFRFDGNQFLSVWKNPDTMAEDSDKILDVTSDGFIVKTLVDPTGGAAHSPSVVHHEQYNFFAEKPVKISEWKSGYSETQQ